jgi:hypothetical protein
VHNQHMRGAGTPAAVGRRSHSHSVPMTKDMSMLTATVREKPAERVSRGCTSEGISQPSGPQDQANPAGTHRLTLGQGAPGRPGCTRLHQ